MRPNIGYAIKITTADSITILPIDAYLRLPIEAVSGARVALIPMDPPKRRWTWLLRRRLAH